MKYLSALAPLFVYSYLRFFARPQLLALFGPNGDYWFEVLFCILALILHFKRILFLFNKRLIKLYTLSLAGGFLTLLGAKLFKLTIPFDLTEFSNIMLLVLWGPILEEFLFRFALYWPLHAGLGKVIAGLITSLFFSYCHFHAYFLVPRNLKSFVIYQTIYTFIIGYWWVEEYQKERNLVAPLGMHILFNFGFYLGLLLI